MNNLIHNCTLCPRRCCVDRTAAAGFCGEKAEIRAARAALHFGEEPCISGKNGSGTVFFSGCSLRCVFCQNFCVSRGEVGKTLSVEELVEVFHRLEDSGAENLNLVTGTHFIPQIAEALTIFGHRLTVVWNSGGYESVESMRLLDGLVDVYMPDLKFFSSEASQRYCGAADYFQVASAAIREMLRQTGRVRLVDGLLKKGVLIRHLVMPTLRHDSIRLLDWIAEELEPIEVLVSVMCQYTPEFLAEPLEYKELNRRISTFEYRSVAEHAAELGLYGFFQDRSSACTDMTPDFDLSGL